MAAKRYLLTYLDSTVVSPKTVTAKSCYVTSVVITCNNAGTGWTLRVEDIDSPPKVLIANFLLHVPSDGLPNVNVSFDEPVLMKQGINLVFSGTAGVAIVRMSVQVTQQLT